MSKRVTFFYDYGSPAGYLAYKRLPPVAARHKADIDHQPVLVGGIFKATNNQPPIDVANKAVWFWADLERWAARHRIAFRRNPHFPVSSLHLMRGAMVAEQDGQLVAYSDAVYDGLWADGLNMADPAIVAGVLDKAGIDSKRIFSAADDPAVKSALRNRTDDAVARGAFGVPTFVVDDTLYFGQDRLDFVEEHLAR